MEVIKLKNITKKFGDKTVYDNFNLDIEKNKVLCVLGESGTGKTTLLNIIAGLTDYQGEIINLDKKISMVFQNSVLIPNLTVEKNLKLINQNADIDSALKSVGLPDCKNLYPKELSAGMQRRVAILRAVLYPSSVLLLDEAFNSLDIALKYSLINTLKEMQINSPKTVISVTHDIKEAVSFADRIIVVKNKNIIYDTNEITHKTENQIFDLMIKG